MDQVTKKKIDAEHRLLAIKLLCVKVMKAGSPEEFVRQAATKTWYEAACSGFYIYPDVFWMNMLTARTGKKLPNGNKWFTYIRFLPEVFPRGKRFYRFRWCTPVAEDATGVYPESIYAQQIHYSKNWKYYDF